MTFSVRAALFRMKRLYSWSEGVKNLLRVVPALLNIARMIRGSMSLPIVKSTYILAIRLNKLQKSNGTAYMAQFLKTMQILIIKRVAIDPMKIHSRSYGLACSVTRTGLPRILPLYFRNKIRERNRLIIRFVLTICNLYRVLPYDGVLKLSTITNDSEYTIPEDFEEFLKMSLWEKSFKYLTLDHKFEAYQIEKAGAMVPGFLKSTIGWFAALIEITRRPGLWTACNAILDSYPQTRGLQAFRQWVVSITGKAKAPGAGYSEILHLTSNLMSQDEAKTNLFGLAYEHGANAGRILRTQLLGRLSLKWEPGKIRVFAMVDAFSQWVLKPLHLSIFDWLGNKRTCDGTFDQVGALKSFYERLALTGESYIFSYDLSAATDRLPIKLQEIILNNMIQGKHFGTYWSKFLVDRIYDLVSSDPRARIQESVRYVVGQPMGAYSSWGMLALTHHLIVQFAAWRVTGKIKWFDLYIVLGDDILIGHPDVAREYYQIMTNDLKVSINLSKSIVSPCGFSEYAKKLTSFEGDFTPISLGELSSWEQNPAGILETMRKQESVTVPLIMRLLGKGPLSSNNVRNAYFEVASNIHTETQSNYNLLDVLVTDTMTEHSLNFEDAHNRVKLRLYTLWWDEVYRPCKEYIDAITFKPQWLCNKGITREDLNLEVLSIMHLAEYPARTCPLKYSPMMTRILYGGDSDTLDKLGAIVDLGSEMTYATVSSSDLLKMLWDNPIDLVSPGLALVKDNPLLVGDRRFTWWERPSTGTINTRSLNWHSFAKSSKLRASVIK